MNRIDRISAKLIQLQSHSLVKAQQISERFNISIRTVYRDIRTLEEAGIPIIGNPGIGYSLAEGFKLSPLMFTQKEALSFLIAEKLVHELTDSNSNEHYKSGIEKIRSVTGLDVLPKTLIASFSFYWQASPIHPAKCFAARWHEYR